MNPRCLTDKRIENMDCFDKHIKDKRLLLHESEYAWSSEHYIFTIENLPQNLVFVKTNVIVNELLIF